MAEMKIYQDVELSLTENLIPTVVPVKQFDHKARKIRCVLYKDSVEYAIPEGVIVNCTGSRPDGHLFQYSSETAPELVSVVDNAVVFTVTDFMTEVSGRFPIDVMLLESDGSVLGAFCLTLRVERAAAGNGKIAVITYVKAVAAVKAGIYECLITEEGYFGVKSNDALGYMPGSVSSTIDRLRETILNTTITDNGHLTFETEDGLQLAFATDTEGRAVVKYREPD